MSTVTSVVFTGRVFFSVFEDLFLDGRRQVNVEVIGQGKAVAGNIRQFFLYFLPLVGVVEKGGDLLISLPLEVFHQFCRFDSDRHGQVLGIVKLLPVSLFYKISYLPAKFSDGRVFVVHGSLSFLARVQDPDLHHKKGVPRLFRGEIITSLEGSERNTVETICGPLSSPVSWRLFSHACCLDIIY